MASRVKAGALIAALLCAGLSLSACSSTSDFEMDPAYWFPDGKKKLPGERREVFPGGVPGVTQGVPPEMIKGTPQQQAAQAAESGAPPQQAEPQPEAKAPPKSRPKKVARPAAPPSEADAGEPQPAARQAQPSGAWPAPQAAQQQRPQAPAPAPANSAWPAPPGTGTFTR
ncbi:MAG: hypothetical protein ABW198_08550 [Pseudorhodoplanes sp.]|jgi:hypothetical protein